MKIRDCKPKLTRGRPTTPNLATTMAALLAVPKSELDQQIDKFKKRNSHTNGKPSKRP